jgi:hypothetical protein
MTCGLAKGYSFRQNCFRLSTKRSSQREIRSGSANDRVRRSLLFWLRPAGRKLAGSGAVGGELVARRSSAPRRVGFPGLRPVVIERWALGYRLHAGGRSSCGRMGRCCWDRKENPRGLDHGPDTGHRCFAKDQKVRDRICRWLLSVRLPWILLRRRLADVRK